MFGGRERGTSVGNHLGNQIHDTEIYHAPWPGAGWEHSVYSCVLRI